MIRVLVTGGRDYRNWRALRATLTKLHQGRRISAIIHGACGATKEDPEPPYKGADGFADDWAQLNGVAIERCPADWERLGDRAGMARNREMVGKSIDVVVACPGEDGTHGTVALARGLGIEIVHVEDQR